MAAFFAELWESIFTPGPTPTLLIATNVTFAALQVLLLILLIATYNIHFLILSTLSAGLWTSVNWFAHEVKEHQQQQEEMPQRDRAVAAVSNSDESETEVEVMTASTVSTTEQIAGPTAQSASVEVAPVDRAGGLKQRKLAMDSASQGTKSSASTEDEWEKVSENENEKSK